MNPEIKTARIWAFINDGMVKLAIPRDRPLHWGKTGRDDEGWASEGHRWTWDGETLIEEIDTDGTDCDGRLSRSYTHFTTPGSFRVHDSPGRDNLFAIENDEDGRPRAVWSVDAPVLMPAWHELKSGQRDYRAEAAGY